MGKFSFLLNFTYVKDDFHHGLTSATESLKHSDKYLEAVLRFCALMTLAVILSRI